VSDIPVKPTALNACLEALIPTLKALDGTPIYSSPLGRCTALACAISAELPATNLQMCPELLELDFGHWEGLSWDAIYATDAQGLNAWAAQPLIYAPGGGESLAQLNLRIMTWLKNLCSNGIEQAIVVTHGGPLRVLLSVNENSLDAVLSRAAPPWASLTVIEITL
jgi:broad specificity phosphatase PhoE